MRAPGDPAGRSGRYGRSPGPRRPQLHPPTLQLETTYTTYKEEAASPLDSQEQHSTAIPACGLQPTALLDPRGVLTAITARGEQSPSLLNP